VLYTYIHTYIHTYIAPGWMVALGWLSDPTKPVNSAEVQWLPLDEHFSQVQCDDTIVSPRAEAS
jgi:hypothetical protein